MCDGEIGGRSIPDEVLDVYLFVHFYGFNTL